MKEERAREAERQRQEREVDLAIKRHNESLQQKQQNTSATAPSVKASTSTLAASGSQASRQYAGATASGSQSTSQCAGATASCSTSVVNKSYTVKNPKHSELQNEERSETCDRYVVITRPVLITSGPTAYVLVHVVYALHNVLVNVV